MARRFSPRERATHIYWVLRIQSYSMTVSCSTRTAVYDSPQATAGRKTYKKPLYFTTVVRGFPRAISSVPFPPSQREIFKSLSLAARQVCEDDRQVSCKRENFSERHDSALCYLARLLYLEEKRGPLKNKQYRAVISLIHTELGASGLDLGLYQRHFSVASTAPKRLKPH